MPFKPKVPCKQPGCAAMVEPGKQYCEQHRKMHPEITRSASTRGYGSRWQRESKAYLRANSLCILCARKDPPRYTKATVVDHITPHRGDQKLFWDRGNWQSLCKNCHDKKTWNEDSNPVYTF